MALIRDTISAIRIPKIPMKANEKRRPSNSAIYPITGGPIKNPKKLTLDTIVNASPGGTDVLLPARLYNVGTIVDTPSPTIIKPIIDVIK